MSVEQADVIDFIAHNPRTNEVKLVMVETRDWDRFPEAVQQLDFKFAAYARFVLSGALSRQAPDLSGCPVCIQLEHFNPIPEQVDVLLRQWAGKLSAIPVSVWTGRRHWNLIGNLLKRLTRRFGDPHRDLVQWTPEPGFTGALMTGSQFTEEFSAALRKAMPKAQVQVVGELEINVVAPTGSKSNGYLSNAYTQYLLAPENFDDIIRKYTASILETAAGLSEQIDRSRIVPILKDRAWVQEMIDTMKARIGEKPVSSVHEPYNEELMIVYAQDTPTNVSYLTSEKFCSLNLDMKELRTLACANLTRLLPAPDIKLEDGLYRIRAGGDYDACLLLLDDFWDAATIEVEGELIAAVPARDFLAVTGSQTPGGVTTLKKVAEAVATQAPYRLTPKLFVRRNGKFFIYED